MNNGYRKIAKTKSYPNTVTNSDVQRKIGYKKMGEIFLVNYKLKVQSLSKNDEQKITSKCSDENS